MAEALEIMGFKINRTKIEYMNCNFNEDVQRTRASERIEA